MKQILFFLFFLISSTNILVSQSLYFGSIGLDIVGVANQDGSGSPITLFDINDGVNNPKGVAVDILNGKVYWSRTGAIWCIYEGNIDGSGTPVQLYCFNPGQPNSIALDQSNGKIYFSRMPASGGTDNISVANLDGSGGMTILYDNVEARAIFVDVMNGKIYWAEVNDDKISVGNTDGSGSPITLFDKATDGVSKPYGVSVDVVNSKIYWAEIGQYGGGNRISMGNLDGSGSPTVLFDNPTDGVNDPRSISLNLNTNTIFWTEIGSDAIKSGNMDGSGSPTTLFTGLNNPNGIAIDGNAGNLLPVELIDFKGVSKNDASVLSWSTASESNNLGFDIQKSKNGNDWETIGFVEGHGTTNETNTYEYSDRLLFPGNNYYRLKQIDFDGALEYSKIITVEYSDSEKDIQVFPNPSNGSLNIQITNPSNQSMKVLITNNLGITIWESERMEEMANWSKEMKFDRNGIYFVFAQFGNEIISKRVVITDK